VRAESAPEPDDTRGEAADEAPQPARPSPGAGPSPGELDATALRGLWPEVLNVIEAGSKTVRALLGRSQVGEATGNTVTLAVAPSLAKRLAEERNVAAIAEGLAKVVGGSWQVVVKPAPGAAPAAGARRTAEPEPDPRDEPGYDPSAAAAPVPT